MTDSTFIISGLAQVGQTLSASTDITYQWYRSGIPIANATLSTYAVMAADVGHTISVTRATSSMASTPIIAAPHVVMPVINLVLDMSNSFPISA